MNTQILEYMTWDFIGSIIFVNFLKEAEYIGTKQKWHGYAMDGNVFSDRGDQMNNYFRK